MGQIPVQGPHEKSLSGMSNAWRWANQHKNMALSAALGTIAVVLLFLALLQGTKLKLVTIVADGQEWQVVTSKTTAADVLGEQGITVGAHDQVSIPLHAPLHGNQTVAIERAFPVKIQVDGETREVYSVADRLGNILDRAGIRLGPLDKVEPSLVSVIDEETEVKIVRVERVVEISEHPLPYKTVTKTDHTLQKGKERVIQKGQAGKLIKRIEKVYEDGVLVSEQVLSRDIQQEALPHIVAVGTKAEPASVSNAVQLMSAEAQEVNLDGMKIGVKGVLKNVTLTAYSAHYASTGKKEGDPGYGITASGTKVKEGQTIAVDPDVIPLGWWVYIQGIGFRRAEDTGSAVKGKKIDIYFENEKYAQKFGTKKGYTVYVIGPKKPAVN